MGVGQLSHPVGRGYPGEAVGAAVGVTVGEGDGVGEEDGVELGDEVGNSPEFPANNRTVRMTGGFCISLSETKASISFLY